MDIDYPVVINMRSVQLDELEQCEYGSYEDHIAAEGTVHHSVENGQYTKGVDASDDGARLSPYDSGALHIVELIQRSPHKTRVYLNTQEEIREFYGASLSGTFGLYCLRTCQRLYKQLNPLIEDREFADRITYGGLGY